MTLYAPENAQENRILRLLQQQYPHMAASYRVALSALSTALEKESDWKKPPLLWANEHAVGEKFFRYNFDVPLFFIVSYPVSRFRAYRNYSVPIEEERSYYLRMALVPIYLSNLNRITCLKLYGDIADGFVDPQGRAITSAETVWQVSPDNFQPPQYSSLNFVLKRGSAAIQVRDDLAEVVSNYLKYGFWSFVKTGFASNAHIIFSANSVNHIHKASKNIFVIKRLHSPEKVRLAPYYYPIVQKADIETYDENGRRRFSTYIAKDVVDKLDESKAWTTDASALIVNGIIYELKGRADRPEGELTLLSVISELLPTDIELSKTIAALVAFKLFIKSESSTGYIASEDSFHSEIENQFKLYAPMLGQGMTLFAILGRPLRHILAELYPIVIMNEKNVYFVHPSIISALISLGLEESILIDKDVSILIHFMKFLERIRTEEKQGRLRFAEEWEYFKVKGTDFETLVRAAKSAYRSITISRLLERHF